MFEIEVAEQLIGASTSVGEELSTAVQTGLQLSDSEEQAVAAARGWDKLLLEKIFLPPREVSYVPVASVGNNGIDVVSCRYHAAGFRVQIAQTKCAYSIVLEPGVLVKARLQLDPQELAKYKLRPGVDFVDVPVKTGFQLDPQELARSIFRHGERIVFEDSAVENERRFGLQKMSRLLLSIGTGSTS